MNILVVGGAGYIGGALTDILKDTDHDVLVYDMLLYEESYRKDVPFVYGDIRDFNKLKEYLDWAETVVWFAALVGDGACSLNETVTNEINRDSLLFLKNNFHGKIIYMSSCSVYGASDSLLDEGSSLNPLSLYAQGKVEAEQILQDTNAICFRLGTLHGISDRFSRIRFDLVVNTLVMRAIYHNKIQVFGGEQYRPLLHVRDVARTISLALGTNHTGIFNLHSENITIIGIAEQIKKYFPKLIVQETDVEFQDSRNYRVTSQKASDELGFKPEIVLDEAIIELKTLLETGRIKDTFIKRFSNYLYLKPLLGEQENPLGREVRFNV